MNGEDELNKGRSNTRQEPFTHRFIRLVLQGVRLELKYWSCYGDEITKYELVWEVKSKWQLGHLLLIAFL